MNKNFLDFILSVSEDNYSEFIDGLDLDIKVDNNLETKPLDFSWIDIVEKYIPFLKNAVESPYQEILDVVDSKKLYENRFLISLILKLDSFIEEKYKEVLERFNLYERDIRIKGNASFELEDVEIDIKIKSKKKEDLEKGIAYGLSAKERVERLKAVIQTTMETSLFTALKDIKLVTSPIHRTSVILEDRNFKKLLELWEFLENYIIVQKAMSNKKVRAKQQEDLTEKVKNTCFVNYQLCNNINDMSVYNEEYYREFLERIIENLVMESTMDDKTFKRLVNKKFEEVYSKKQNREKNIQLIFNKSIDSYQKQIKDAIRCLK